LVRHFTVHPIFHRKSLSWSTLAQSNKLHGKQWHYRSMFFADKIEENKKSWKAKKNAKYIDI